MFNFVRDKEYKALQSSVEVLVKEKQTLKTELEELKLKKRLGEEEIRHNMRLFEESKKAEVENEKIKINKKYLEDLSNFKEEQRVTLVASLKEFHDRIEKRSDEEVNRIKEMYQSIMGIMPKVNLMLEKKVR